MLSVKIGVSLTRIAGEEDMPAGEIARQIESQCVGVLHKLQAASCDAIGFGALAVRRYPDIGAWRDARWEETYGASPVRVSAKVKVL